MSHVLFVGMDGVRLDTMTGASTPRLDQLAAEGFLEAVTVNAADPTISGPSWTTMLTGVLSPIHNVFDNDISANKIADHPDFLARTRQLGRSTYAAANWPPLVTEAAGGPVVIGGGFMPGDDCGHDLDAWEIAEDAIAADASRVLGAPEAPAASFVYFGSPDAYGHELGVCPRYVGSIERTDRRLGQLLDVLRSRPSYRAEAWTVIVATDHGHRDAGGHGGDSVQERTAWIAAAGPSVPGSVPAALEQADVAAHALAVLGIEPAADLYGVPFGSRAVS